jgi:putative transcriptional regulator
MKKPDFDRLVAGVRQAIAIRRCELEPSRITEFAPIDTKGIRKRLDKSQSEFALGIGVSLSALQNWEQGRRPEGSARALLKVAAENSDAIAAALGQQGSRMTTSANDHGGKGQI